MGTNTKIAYAHHSWSGWRGCEHATLKDGSEHPGCANCFAEAMSRRNPTMLGVWGPEGTRVRASDTYWRKPLVWNAKAEADGERSRVLWDLSDPFEDWQGPVYDHRGARLVNPQAGEGYYHVTGSWSPLGRERLATMSDLRRDAFALIQETPWLDWLILTKRPNLLKISNWWPKTGPPQAPLHQHIRLENVWLGVSVSDQRSADELIPKLLGLRELAGRLWVSVEPLLGPIDLVETWRKVLVPDWIVIGGESGPHRRECKIEWIQDIALHCYRAEIPCFVKQDSHLKPGQQGRIPDELWNVKEFPVG